jgi:hypothetical protein
MNDRRIQCSDLPSVFLSYAREDDEPFVVRLYQDLTSREWRSRSSKGLKLAANPALCHASSPAERRESSAARQSVEDPKSGKPGRRRRVESTDG